MRAIDAGRVLGGGDAVKVRESSMPPEALWVTFFDVDRILSRLRFIGSKDIVEFGCGYGIFTTAAARRAAGLVRGFDIEPEMIAATRGKVDAAGLTNVRLERRDFIAEGTGLRDASADYVMLFNILHAAEPMILVREAFRILRPCGQVGVVHWNHAGTPRGPDPSIRPRPEQCAGWLAEAGFVVTLPPTPLPPYHFGLVGRRPDDTSPSAAQPGGAL
jgi:SAM-dependent methyltransferase